jgi:YVTN family beta-propeller protein
MITIPYHHIDAQLNSGPSSLQEASIQGLDNQNRFLTTINIAFPSDIAVNPETNMMYVIGSLSTVYVINGTTNEVVTNVTLTHSVENSVEDIAVNPETNMIYVALSSSNRTSLVHVIDGKTNDIVSNITIEGGDPTDLAVNPETNMVYLTDDSGSRISTIDGHTNKVHNMIIHNSPKAVAVNPETNMVYVVAEGSDEISVINGSDNTLVTNITVVPRPADVDVNPQTNIVYVTNHMGNRISVINGTTNQEIKTIVGNFTGGVLTWTNLAVDSSINLVYVATSASTVYVIDGTTNNIVSSFMVEARLTNDLAINPKTNVIYATSGTNSIISIIDGKKEIMLADDDISTNQQDNVPGIKVGRKPIDIAVNPETNMIYVIYLTSNIVSVIDGDTSSIVDTITVGTPPSAIDVNPFTNTIYVTSPYFDSVLAIDGATNTITRNITISDTPRDLAINPETNMIYTFNYDDRFLISPSISAIDGATNIEVANLTISDGRYWGLDTNTDTIYLAHFSSDNITVTELRRHPYNSSYYFQIGSETISGLSIEDAGQIVVNPITSLLYVSTNGGNALSEIDPLRGTLLNNFTIQGQIEDIAVNPVTNTVYVTSFYSNTLSSIDLTANAVENVTVAVDPSPLAINPDTNMIYVANYDSNSVSVINGHTNKVIAGVTFNVNPPNAGLIECNGQVISDNYTAIYDTATSLECKAKANSGFQFTSWSGDLISPSSDNNANTRFTVSKYGALSANFINPVQITIPWELLAGIILGPIVGWSIPSIIGWIKSKRDVGKLNYYHKQIARLDEDGRLDEKDIEALDLLRNRVTNAYSEGKLNEKHYETLRGEISTLYEEIFRKKIATLDSNNNYSVAKKPIQEQVAQIRNEIKYAFSKGKINEKHYALLNEDISKLDGKENHNTS